MSLMFPDSISIIPIAKDKYGAVTESAAVPSSAYIEDQDTTRRDAQGTLVQTGRLMLVPKDTTIAIGDMVDVVTLHGATPTTEEGIRREVTQAFRVGGMGISHIELLTKSVGSN